MINWKEVRKGAVVNMKFVERMEKIEDRTWILTNRGDRINSDYPIEYFLSDHPYYERWLSLRD